MKKLVAGVDIGGTNTVFALMDEFGKIHAKNSFPTKDYTEFDLYVAKLFEEINNLSKEIDEPHIIEAVGIGAPNGNYYSGSIEHAPNLIWKGKLPLSKLLSPMFNGIPVVVTNDANAAAIGEMIYGGAKDMKDFIVITLGTGLGSGIVVNGNVVYGNDGFAGEVGHIKVVSEHGRECGCGRSGCLECYASATGLKRTAFEMMANLNSPSKLRDIPFTKLTSKDIALAAKSGDVLAKKCFEYTGEILGEALANVIAVTAPEAIFLFGGVANAGDLILNPTKQSMEKNLLQLWKGKVKLILSSIDSENAPILGAGALAIKEVQKRSEKATGTRKVI